MQIAECGMTKRQTAVEGKKQKAEGGRAEEGFRDDG
jgi:hypothetical protein